MSKKQFAMVTFSLYGLMHVCSAISDDMAKHVIAAEITGVVLDKANGTPIPDAVVAIRFMRGNTGHSSPHCFRSMAVQTDAQGRFKFVPWTQEKTKANGTYGEIEVHKSGYDNRAAAPVFVNQSRRDFFGIRFSSDIQIPKTDLRIELSSWAGTEELRGVQMVRLASEFSCTWDAYNDSLILAESILQEIRQYPSARVQADATSSTTLRVIEAIVTKSKSAKN